MSKKRKILQLSLNATIFFFQQLKSIEEMQKSLKICVVIVLLCQLAHFQEAFCREKDPNYILTQGPPHYSKVSTIPSAIIGYWNDDINNRVRYSCNHSGTPYVFLYFWQEGLNLQLHEDQRNDPIKTPLNPQSYVRSALPGKQYCKFITFQENPGFVSANIEVNDVRVGQIDNELALYLDSNFSATFIDVPSSGEGTYYKLLVSNIHGYAVELHLSRSSLNHSTGAILSNTTSDMDKQLDLGGIEGGRYYVVIRSGSVQYQIIQYTVEVVSVCKCKGNYLWNSTRSECVLNCLQKHNALNIADDSSDVCLCRAGFHWNQNLLTCVIDCSLINHATFLKDGTTNQCECEPKYLWDIETNSCQIDCSGIHYTAGKDKEKEDTCLCESGFSWKSQEKICQISCSGISNVLGLKEGKVDECICDSRYQWDSSLKVCSFKCSKDPFAIENSSNSPTETCSCLEKFQWDSTDLRCKFKCQDDPNAVGLATGKVDECQCVEKYFWSEEKCVFNCQQDTYATGLVLNSIDSCSCVDKFSWNSETSQCVIDCEQVTFSLGQSQGSVDICLCQEDFIWNQDSKRCQVDCASDKYATGFSENVLDQCSCTEKFLWNSEEKSCLIDCGSIKRTDGKVDGSVDECKCKGNLSWNLSYFQCKANGNLQKSEDSSANSESQDVESTQKDSGKDNGK